MQPERPAINTPHHSLSNSKDESFPELHSLSFQPDFTVNTRLYPGGFFFKCDFSVLEPSLVLEVDGGIPSPSRWDHSLKDK